MTYNPGKTVNHAGTDPDKGLKTRPYLKVLLVAVLVILVVAFIFARLGSRSAPRVGPGTTSSGESHPATAPQ